MSTPTTWTDTSSAHLLGHTLAVGRWRLVVCRARPDGDDSTWFVLLWWGHALILDHENTGERELERAKVWAVERLRAEFGAVLAATVATGEGR